MTLKKERKFKIYDINLIKSLRISISVKQNITYWAFVDAKWKRVAKEYYDILVSSGIEIISISTIRIKKKSQCLSITKQSLQCRRVMKGGDYCFQHTSKKALTQELSINNQFKRVTRQSKHKVTFIDLFSGCGGVSTGFIKAGIEPIYCLDSDADCCATIKANHTNVQVSHSVLKEPDVTSHRDKVDILVGGTPCQSFSEIGLRQGLLDKRGQALLTFISWVFFLRPKVFIIENVPGLLSHNKGLTYKYIIQLLKKNNLYHIESKLLNMADFGVPQKRRRVYIIGTLKLLNITIFPLPEVNERLVLSDVLEKTPVSEGVKYSLTKLELFKKIPEGGCWVNLPVYLQKEYLGKSFYSSGGKRGILRRLSMNKPSLTLLCSPTQKQTERCHPTKNRPLTIREYARIQTFSDSYVFKGSLTSQYRQIGNAVPPKFSYRLGVHLVNKLQSNQKYTRKLYSLSGGE